MSRFTALMLASFFTTVAGVIFFAAMIFNLFTPPQASQAAEVPTIAAPVAVAPIIDPAATQLATLQSTLQAREDVLKAQIDSRQQALSELEVNSRNEIVKLDAQLRDLQAQLKQNVTHVEAIQTHANQLQQAIAADGQTYQNQMVVIQAKTTEGEQQFQQALAILQAQLQATYNQVSTQQPAAAEAYAAGGRDGDDDNRSDKHDSGNYGGGDDDDGDDDHGGDDDDD